MERDYIEKREAVAKPLRGGVGKGVKSGDDLRRTRPKVEGSPPSPAQIDALYKKDRIPGMNSADGDGLETPQQRTWQDAVQRRQFPEDQFLHPADAQDVPLKGDRAWLRGGGKAGYGHADFDYGHFDKGNQPGRWASGGKPNTASGKDEHKSPFSAAWRRGSGEGF